MNVMVVDTAMPVSRLAGLGVARISQGPGPFMRCMALLKAQAESAACGVGVSPVTTPSLPA